MVISMIWFRARCGQLKKLWNVVEDGVEDNRDYEVSGLVAVPAIEQGVKLME